MTIEENKAIIRRYYHELWNAWNLTLMDQIIDPEIRFRGSLGVTVQGRDGFRQYMETVRAAFPNFHNLIEDVTAEEDRVVARLTYSGTHQGPLFGIAPTGKAIAYAGVAIFRLTGGKIVEGWVLGDTLSLLRQLGAVPTAGPTG